uniref:Uncharacterized protein n=1 Tax=viral metagenome TaxID=1070528 RepID=A0A6M3Y5B2_9ZZZZ
MNRSDDPIGIGIDPEQVLRASRLTGRDLAEAQAAFDEEDEDDLLPSCWITPTRTKEVDR